MKRRNLFRNGSLWIIPGAILCSTWPCIQVHAARAAKISQEEWEKIAGSKLNDTYSILKGDTLGEISKKLFGDPKYWKKIWQINAEKIANPNRLDPGITIAFNSSKPGSDLLEPPTASDAPAAGLKNKEPPLPKVKKPKPRSTEWKTLPPQIWEKSEVRLDPPVEIDPLGIDKKNIAKRNRFTGINLNVSLSTDKIPYLGKITAGPETEYFSATDTIFIHGEDNLQVGEIYAVTEDPALLKPLHSDRSTYIYNIVGRVKILGVREGIYIASMLSGEELVHRNQYLIPNPPHVPQLAAEAGHAPLKGRVIFKPFDGASVLTQHSHVIIDLGAKDGIKPGMFFRTFEHEDRLDGKRITRADFIVQAEMQVIQVSSNFCEVLITHSNFTLVEFTPAVLVTDLNTLRKHAGFDLKPMNQDEVEDLEHLESPDVAAPKEEVELKELESIKDLPPALELPSTEPNPSPTPTDKTEAPAPDPSATNPTPDPSTITPAPNAADTTLPASDTPPTSSAPAVSDSVESVAPPPPPAENGSSAAPTPTEEAPTLN